MHYHNAIVCESFKNSINKNASSIPIDPSRHKKEKKQNIMDTKQIRKLFNIWKYTSI